MSSELARIGWPEHQITWYPAIDPREAAGFRNAGYRGCFLSHLAALNLARNAGYQTVLILEDDCDFSPNFPAVAAALAGGAWGIAYLGHVEHVDIGPSPLVEWLPALSVKLTHCYAVQGFVLPSLCAYLEAMILRPAGVGERRSDEPGRRLELVPACPSRYLHPACVALCGWSAVEPVRSPASLMGPRAGC